MPEASTDTLNRRPVKLRSFLWLQSFSRRLARAGVSPNAISVFGIIVSVMAGLAFFCTGRGVLEESVLWLGGTVLILVRILANICDGLVAIECGKATPVGKLYNEAPDRISDVLILVGAGYANGGNSELGYLAACVALFVAYVRILITTAGAPSDFRGPMAKGHRMITLMLTAVFMGLTPETWHVHWGPDQQWGIMSVALIGIIIGGCITAARRLQHAANFLRALDE